MVSVIIHACLVNISKYIIYIVSSILDTIVYYLKRTKKIIFLLLHIQQHKYQFNSEFINI